MLLSVPDRWTAFAEAREFQSPLWGLDECFVGDDSQNRDRGTEGFSPLYGDWMSASPRPWRRPCELGSPAARRGFQSPLWGLDECFVRRVAGPAADRRRRFSPLYGDWMSASRLGRRRARERPLRFSPLYGDWMSASSNAGFFEPRGTGIGFSPLYGDWMSASTLTLEPSPEGTW